MNILIIFLASDMLAFQPVDINIASEEQVALLPGIGKRFAENIVARRKRYPFKSVDDLASIDGITGTKLAKIKMHVMVGKARAKVTEANKSAILDDMRPLSPKPIIAFADLEQHMLQHQGLKKISDGSLARRVRTAAWLPNLSTYVDTDYGAVATKKAAIDHAQTRDGRTLGFGIKASFDLDKLIFSKDEIDVQKLTMNRQEKRNEMIMELHKLYFRYVKLARTRVREGEHEQNDKLVGELLETEALLDSLSGGAFTNYWARKSIPEAP